MMTGLKRWWWWLWTGDSNEAATRRRIEQDVRRFGGTVLWAGQAEALREFVSAARYALDNTDWRLPYVEPQVDRDVARQLIEIVETMNAR